MNIHFKVPAALLSTVRIDLSRPHAFAHERVGFIGASLSAAYNDVIVLAREYRPVRDDEYLRDSSVGAMMGPDAIRRAMQWAMQDGLALFHAHTHEGRGIPGFSGTDIRENAKFIPDFANVSPRCLHGAIVLSNTAARGYVWFDAKKPTLEITNFTEVGFPMRKWGTA